MVISWRGLLSVCLSGLLFACATTQQTTTTPDTQPVITRPTVTIDELPCAQVSMAEKLSITYPAGSLYLSGAALPKMEGLTCLDVFADWLKPMAQSDWQVKVAGESGHGYDPQKLAAKRQELLQRYFQRQGIDTSTWSWQTAPDEHFQLQFTGSP